MKLSTQRAASAIRHQFVRRRSSIAGARIRPHALETAVATTMESLEDRVLLAAFTAVFDNSKTPFTSNASVNIAGIYPGQQVQIEAFVSDPKKDGDGACTVNFGGQPPLKVPGENLAHTKSEFTFPGGSTTLSVSDLDPNDPLTVIVRAQAPTDVRLASMAFNNKGGVDGTYAVEGNDVPADQSPVLAVYWDNIGAGPTPVLDPATNQPITFPMTKQVGTWSFHVGSSAVFGNKPDGARGVFAVADAENVLAHDPDKGNNRSATLYLPNYSFDPTQPQHDPKWMPDGSLQFWYVVDGEKTPYDINPTIKVFWSTSQDEEGIIREASPAVPIVKSAGAHAVSIGASRFTKRPAGADYLVVKLDGADQVREPYEGDNIRAVDAAPDLSIGKLRWTQDGQLIVDIENDGAPLQLSATPQLVAYWTNDSYLSDDTLIKQAASVRFGRGHGNQQVVLSPRKFSAPDEDTTHLVVQLEDASAADAADDPLADAAIKLPVVSYELADAPPATTAADRVRLWTRKHERIILAQASAFGIDPRAITAAIAWEATQNVKLHPSTLLGAWGRLGPGKVHYIQNNISFLWSDSVAEEVENVSKLLPARDASDRQRYLWSPLGSAQYIAAITASYAQVFDANGVFVPGRPGVSIRHDLGILTQLYQGSGRGIAGYMDLFADPASKDSYIKGGQPRVPRGVLPGVRNDLGRTMMYMGDWVSRNVTPHARAGSRYVDSLLAATWKPTSAGSPLPQPRVAVTARTQRTASVSVRVEADPGYTLASFGQPTAGSVNNVNGEFIYTPDPAFVGDDSFDFTLTDGERVVIDGSVDVSVSEISAPTFLTAARDGMGVVVSWTNTEVTATQVGRSTDGVNWSWLPAVPAGVTAFRDSGPLEAGRRYYYEARNVLDAADGTFYSPASNVDAAIPRPPFIAAPSSLVAARDDATPALDVVVTWQDNSDNESGFRIARSADGVNFDNVGQVGPGVTSFRDADGLVAGHRYTYEARAFLDQPEGRYFSNYSNLEDAIPRPPALAAPFGLTAARDGMSVVVSWSNPEATATATQVGRSTDGVNWSWLPAVPAGVTAFRDSGPLEAGRRYYYEARNVLDAADGTFYSPASNVDAAIPRPPFIAAPSSLVAARDDATPALDVVVTWQDNSDNESGFRIARSPDGVNFDNVGQVGAGVTAFRDALRLVSGQRVYYKVRAFVAGPDETYYSDYSNLDDAIPRAISTLVASAPVQTAMMLLAPTPPAKPKPAATRETKLATRVGRPQRQAAAAPAKATAVAPPFSVQKIPVSKKQSELLE